MHRIQKLSPDIINKIAAGEVVERPASVIKELVENSLDAGATKIFVEVRDGGIDYISVIDNGKGMSQEDLPLAIERHATSKITSFEDLQTLHTMGFRGEALAAISSVSLFSIETKEPGALEGSRLSISDDHGITITSCGCPEGTRVTIEDLFYSLPARKKFLKSAQTEYAHCLEILTQLSLLHPSIEFSFTSNNKLTFHFTPTTWEERISDVLGKDNAKHLISIDNDGALSLHGYLGNPEIAKSNTKSQYIFVNNRPVNDYLIARAVKEGYGTTISKELYPVFILSLTIDASKVDVNVHPRKSEVKFQDTQEVYRSVLWAVKNALAGADIVPSIELVSSSSVKENFEAIDAHGIMFKPRSSNPSSSLYTNPSPKTTTPMPYAFSPVRTTQSSEWASQIPKTQDIGDWTLVGQIHKSYILVESPRGFLIIDQHAAAERFTYEKLKKEYEESRIKVQKLLVPITLECSHKEVSLIEEHIDLLQNLGFDIDTFGDNTFIVNGIPHELSKRDPEKLMRDLISDLEDQSFGKSVSIDEKRNALLASAACRGSIMFGDELSHQEQVQLLKNTQSLLSIAITCPHGRPFMHEVTLDELSKRFKRS